MPRDLIAATENTFEINLENAGNVPLDIKITSPTGLNGKIKPMIRHLSTLRGVFLLLLLIVPLKVDEASPRSTTKKVRFTPNETGVHYLNAKFGSEVVPGNAIVFSLVDDC